MPEPQNPPGGLTAMGLLRLWLWGSGAVLVFLLIWAIAPVLFLVLALTAAIGIVCAVTIKLARVIEAWKNAPERDP
jgi:hypothetical protein